jgi:hypothetical protein
MKYRANFLYILVPILQIVFFIAAYDVSNYTARKMGLVYSRGVGWGIAIQMYVVYYVCIIMVLGVLSYLMEKKVLLLSIIASLLFAFIILPVVDDFPYRGGLVILLGIMGVFMNYLFLLKYKAKPVRNV